MLEIVRIEGDTVEVKISVPKISPIELKRGIGSSSLISWAKIGLPTLEATFPFRKRWLRDPKKHKESSEFRFTLQTSSMDVVQSFCRRLLVNRKLPISEYNIGVVVDIPDVSRYSTLKFTRKRKWRLRVSPTVVVEFYNPVSVPQFRRFLRDLTRKYKGGITPVVSSHLLLLFSRFLTEKDDFPVQCKFRSDDDVLVVRKDFVPTGDPKKLRPFTEARFRLKFEGLDGKSLRSLFEPVTSGRDLATKLLNLSTILSLLDFSVDSCKYDDPRRCMDYFVECGVDMDTPEGLRKFLLLLRSWVGGNEDAETH